jgi:hypothetical protein
MKQFSTIHVFGYGETQIIGETNNGKVQSSELTSLTAFVDHIKTFLPATGVTLTNYHVIHIFEGSDVRYLGVGTEDRKEETSFSVKYDQIDIVILDTFVNEIISKLPPSTEN